MKARIHGVYLGGMVWRNGQNESIRDFLYANGFSDSEERVFIIDPHSAQTSPCARPSCRKDDLVLTPSGPGFRSFFDIEGPPEKVKAFLFELFSYLRLPIDCLAELPSTENAQFVTA